jgi:prepilin-type N-terminal cleavage/methylation domain-containing protein
MRKLIKLGDKSFFNKGFTMVEIMVVVAIILIFSSIMVANYRFGNQRLSLEMQTNQFAQNVRKMQSWSMSAHKVLNISQPGYGIFFDQNDPSKYYLYVDNGYDQPSGVIPGNGKYDSGFDTIQEIIVFSDGAKIQSCNPARASITFIPPDPSVKIVDGAGGLVDQTTISFASQDSVLTHTVVINKAGLIYAQ